MNSTTLMNAKNVMIDEPEIRTEDFLSHCLRQYAIARGFDRYAFTENGAKLLRSPCSLATEFNLQSRYLAGILIPKVGAALHRRL